jgi:hypothetical protein
MKIILLLDASNGVRPALSIQVNFFALLLFELETSGLNRQLEMGDFHHKLA